VHGPEVQAGADVALPQRRHETVARHAGRIQHLDDVEMPGVEVVVAGHSGAADLRHLREQPVVEAGELAPPGVELVHRGELVDAEGGLQVHEVVLEPRPDDLDLRRAALGVAVPGGLLQAVEAQGPQLAGEAGVRERQHAALAGGHVLDRMEGEHAQAVEEADVPAFVERANAVGRVLEDPQRVPPGEVEQRIHVGRGAAEVHGEDAHRAIGDGGGGRHGIDLQRLGIDVHEDRRAAQDLDHVGGGGPGHGGGDHLVAGRQSEGHEADVEAAGGGGEGERFRRAGVGGEVALEALGLRAGGDPARAQRVDDLVDLHLADGRPGERQEGVALEEGRGHARSVSGKARQPARRSPMAAAVRPSRRLVINRNLSSALKMGPGLSPASCRRGRSFFSSTR
jgi:hypothetical protein